MIISIQNQALQIPTQNNKKCSIKKLNKVKILQSKKTNNGREIKDQGKKKASLGIKNCNNTKGF